MKVNFSLILIFSLKLVYASVPIRIDQTIRPTGHAEFCVHKRFNNYAENHDVFIWPCEPGFSNPNQNGRFLWSYDQNSKLVKSVGSGSNFCWMIKNPEKNTNRVKITACNETDVNQHFEFFSDGRFVPSVRKDLCVSYSLKNVDGILNSGALKIAKCWGTSFLPAQEIFEVANEKFEMCNGVPFLEGKLKCCNDELVVSHDKNCEDFEVSVCNEKLYNTNLQECCHGIVEEVTGSPAIVAIGA